MDKQTELKDFLAKGSPCEPCEDRESKIYSIGIINRVYHNIKRLTELTVTDITDIVVLGSKNVRVYFKFIIREGEDTQQTLESNILVEYMELM